MSKKIPLATDGIGINGLMCISAIGMAKLAVDTGFVSQMYQDLESVHARLEEQ